MSRDTLLILLALVISIAPFAGIPNSWLGWLLPLCGLAVLIIGISLRRERKSQNRTEARALPELTPEPI